MIIGIIGLGFVGNAINKNFNIKNIKTIVYDKYKNNGIGNIKDTFKCDIIFLCLPTLYCSKIKKYNIESIIETCDILKKNNYNGLIVLKSTVEPETTIYLENKYNLNFVHNPEFLSAKTAYEDFNNQTHIVLGKNKNCNENKYKLLYNFYKINYPNSIISECTTTESETMKICVNSFYSIKIQFFTEIYLLCKKLNLNYEVVKNMMLNNNWINKMHTNIPGNDGLISYGGLCFPKDTNALNQYLIKKNLPNGVLNATIQERNKIRETDI